MRYYYYIYFASVVFLSNFIIGQETKCLYKSNKPSHPRVLSLHVTENEYNIFLENFSCFKYDSSGKCNCGSISMLKIDTSGKLILEKNFPYSGDQQFINYFYKNSIHHFIVDNEPNIEKRIPASTIYFGVDNNGKIIFNKRYPWVRLLDYTVLEKYLIFFFVKHSFSFFANLPEKNLFYKKINPKGDLLSEKILKKNIITSSGSFRDQLKVKKIKNSSFLFLNNRTIDSTACHDNVGEWNYKRQLLVLDSSGAISSRQTPCYSGMDMSIENDDSLIFLFSFDRDSLNYIVDGPIPTVEYKKCFIEKRTAPDYGFVKKITIDDLDYKMRLYKKNLYLFANDFSYYLKYDLDLNLMERKETGLKEAYGTPVFFDDKVKIIQERYEHKTHEYSIYCSEIKL